MHLQLCFMKRHYHVGQLTDCDEELKNLPKFEGLGTYFNEVPKKGAEFQISISNVCYG